MNANRETETAYQASFYTDDVGRRRKVGVGDQHTIMKLWQDGHPTIRIAEAFGISTTLVRTICYHTRRGAGKKKEE